MKKNEILRLINTKIDNILKHYDDSHEVGSVYEAGIVSGKVIEDLLYLVDFIDSELSE